MTLDTRQRVKQMMNKLFLPAVLTCCLLPIVATATPKAANTSARHAQSLHFRRGATNLSVRGSLGENVNRFYTLKMNAGQHLKISAISDAKTHSQVVPLLFVTPPCGQFNGDKTNSYAEDSSRAGIYKIEVKTNLMASNARNGNFVLKVSAY